MHNNNNTMNCLEQVCITQKKTTSKYNKIVDLSPVFVIDLLCI